MDQIHIQLQPGLRQPPQGNANLGNRRVLTLQRQPPDGIQGIEQKMGIHLGQQHLEAVGLLLPLLHLQFMDQGIHIGDHPVEGLYDGENLSAVLALRQPDLQILADHIRHFRLDQQQRPGNGRRNDESDNDERHCKKSQSAHV
ncbi:hypothetical protein D3C75_1099230 [compost metagenome]